MDKDNNLARFCLRRVVLWTVGASVVGLRRVRQLQVRTGLLTEAELGKVAGGTYYYGGVNLTRDVNLTRGLNRTNVVR